MKLNVIFVFIQILLRMKDVLCHPRLNIMRDVDDNHIANDKPYEYVKFHLYNKDNFIQGIPISKYNSTIYLKDAFRPNIPLKIVVHGWLGNEESVIVSNIATAYIAHYDYNVIRTDWSELAGYKMYPLSAWNVDKAGSEIAQLVDHLIDIGITMPDQIHLIGHSLGAHVMGIAGASIKHGKVSRITGLDPAKPGFEYTSYEVSRLDPTDAMFVDVIHTAAGAAGFYGALGHADFYPNGGAPPQPGCLSSVDPRELGCSHARSYYFYEESIYSDIGFIATQCEHWSLFTNGVCENNTKVSMGDPTPHTTRGIFYLRTNAESPFAMG